MGADGGINWVAVTGNKDEFYRLIRPFGLLWKNSMYDEYHDDYLENNPLGTPKRGGFFEVSTYGTNQELQGLDDLRDLLEELENYKNFGPTSWDYWEWGPDSNPLDFTWRDLLDEYFTNPTWSARKLYNLPKPVYLMVENWGWCHDKATGRFKTDCERYNTPILDIKLKDWLNQITAVIDVRSFGSCQTWT